MNRRQRIIKLTQHYKQFFAMEQAGGIVLLIATIASLVLSNTSLSEEYLSFWQKDLGGHSLSHWINDGLIFAPAAYFSVRFFTCKPPGSVSYT